MRPSVVPWVCVALLCAASSAVQTADALEIPLETATGPSVRTYGSRYVELDEKGEGSVPFATACGELKMRLVDGALLLDRNGDGTLNEADGEPVGNGKAAEVTVKLFGSSVAYPMGIRITGGERVRLQSQMIVKGEKDGTTYELHDRDMNGSFNDRGTDMLRVNRASQYLAKVLKLEDELQSVTVAEDGKTLTIAPYEGPLANVALSCAEEGWKSELHVTHEDGVYVGDLAAGVPIPPGKYAIKGSRLNSVDESNGRPKTYLYGYDRDAEPTLTLKEGDNALKVGFPLELKAEAIKLEDDASRVKVVSVDLVGAAGEKYRAQVRRSKGESTLECWVRAGDKEEKLASMGYG
jgi:hypothetical protein